MWLRRAVPVAVGCLALGGLTGCTAPIGGIAAISVDESGKPLGYLLMCKGQVDGASIYHDASTSKATSDEKTDGEWDAPRRVTGLASWSLESPIGGWSAKVPLSQLTAGQSYSLSGWSTDNNWSTIPYDFTIDDLAKLKPGEVAFSQPTGVGREKQRVVPVSEFTASLCHDLDL